MKQQAKNFGIVEPIQLWLETVERLKGEILKGVVHPLIATHSKVTCDREYLTGNNYVCVNINVECNGRKEIFAIDIYPSDDGHEVVFSLLRRKYRNSLYKMTKGTEDETSERDEMIGRMVEKSPKESPLHGFSRRDDGFKRMEKKMPLNRSDNLINFIMDELLKIISEIRGDRAHPLITGL